MFDFDRVIERRGTHSSKWDNIAKLSGITSPDAIPMWVADMDFAAPPGVPEARLAQLRDAFARMARDPGFLGEAGQIGAVVKFAAGADVAGLVARVYGSAPALLARAREELGKASR